MGMFPYGKMTVMSIDQESLLALEQELAVDLSLPKNYM
jgi:hypothetical protein